MNIQNFIKDFALKVKEYIQKYEDYSELSGEEKKHRVDELITNYALAAIDNLAINFILKIVLRKLIINNIPTITQAIFDLLAARVKGITK